MSIYIKNILLLISVFLLRPSALGQKYTSLSIILILILGFIDFLEHLRNRNNYHIDKKDFIVLITILSLWFYLLIHSFLIGSNNIEYVLKASITHIIVICCFTIILSNSKVKYLFFRWFIKLLLFFSISYIITFILGMFIGISFDKLILFNIPVEGYENSGNIYFPFTQLYGFMTVGNIKLPRALGFFREAGIFQAYLIWAFFNLEQYNLQSNRNKIILLFGIAGTFSTAGIAVLFGVYAVKLFINKRKLLSICLIGVSIIGLIYTPYIGLKSKSVTHRTSISDRSSATISGLQRLKENPFGVGIYNVEVNDVENSGINLFAISYKIGIVGVLLVILVYFLPMHGYLYKEKYFVGILPFFMTLLISQPILDAPFIYIMLLANYNLPNENIV